MPRAPIFTNSQPMPDSFGAAIESSRFHYYEFYSMSAAPSSFTPQSLRVLLFEDNPLDVALIKKFLLTVGMRSTNIHHADTIPSALQVLSREQIDVCLADYYLRPSTG